MLFYDGRCGLCHRAVRFLAWADARGEAFRFAPLGGATFRALIAPQDHAGLPDSLVLRTTAGRLLTRSTAVLHALGRLGAGWHVLAVLTSLVPRVFRDAVYDFVARTRFRLFETPDDACPVAPSARRSRFLP